MTTANDYSSSQVYQLSNLILSPASGGNTNSIDVTNLMTELSIYEDMYSPMVSGQLKLVDANDMLSAFSISCLGDCLTISLSKTGETNPDILQKVFRITNIQHMAIPVSQSAQVYTISFCSEEMHFSSSFLIYKAYNNMQVSDMINDILTNELLVNPNRVGTIEASSGVFNHVISGWMPFEAINWVTARSTDPSFFWESFLTGFNFKSMKTLVGQQYKRNYFVGPQNTTEDVDTEGVALQRVIDYDFLHIMDSLKGVNNGLYAGSLKTFNPITLQFVETPFSYLTYFNQTSHLREYPFYNNFAGRDGVKLVDQSEAFVRVVPTTYGCDTDTNINTSQPGLIPNQIEKSLLQRNCVLEQLEHFKMRIIVPGDPFITTGDVIFFNVPRATTKSATDQTQNINEALTGKFLVTAINHKITFDGYVMLLEITTDSLSTAYQQADATLGILKN